MLDKIDVNILVEVMAIFFIVILLCLSSFAFIKNPENSILGAVAYIIACIAFFGFLICCFLFLCILIGDKIEDFYFSIPKNRYKKLFR